MADLLKVMEREQLCSEHAEQCFLEAKRRENKRKKDERTETKKPVEWPRADPAKLAKFDPETKRCTMNCGPHRDDPRTDAERKFLCDDCMPANVFYPNPASSADNHVPPDNPQS